MILLASGSAYAFSKCYEKASTVTVPVIGVTFTENGMEGVVGNLTVVVAYPGSGSIYVSSEPLTQVDTQGIARIAVLVASAIAKKDWTKYDFFFRFKTPSVIVGGPSAGMAMTVAVYAALTNQKPKTNVAGTGTISPDGTIGPVGGTYYKLQAAAEKGYTVFLLPFGEENATISRATTINSPFGVIKTIKSEEVNLIDFGKKLGVKVVPVKTIFEALRYWLNNPPIVPRPLLVSELPKEVRDVMTNWVDYYLSMYRKYERSVKGLTHVSVELIDQARTAAEKADELRSTDVYSSVNYAFTAAIRAETAYWYEKMVLNGFKSLIELADNVESLLKEVRGLLNQYSYEYFDSNHIDILLTSANRYLRAKYYYHEALNSTELNDILQYLIYSKYYALATRTWLQLANVFSKGESIDKGRFTKTAEAVYSSANTILAYILAMNINLDRSGEEAIGIYKLASSEGPLQKMAAGMYLNAILTYELHVNYSISLENVLKKSEYASGIALSLAKSNKLNPVIAEIYQYSARKLSSSDPASSVLFYELSAMHVYTLLQLTNK
ncbi:hypothetical protein EYM_07795 [Ignicoccus islandicus DSM 13165]|uniref:Lon proteolytic domain-containing protein n=1 Tax=Ignicoccus islandicus DSM 13165 TaxID=940295 RepID=A0A0U3EED2_9CREN|nr:hypothetical protein EYM_07795 [Ignicoccus islandicus DSM 13165]